MGWYFIGEQISNQNIHSTPELHVVRSSQYLGGRMLPLQLMCPWFNARVWQH